MTLAGYFRRCVYRDYLHIENAGDYAVDRAGSTVYIYFEGSADVVDWVNNFDFPAKPYKRMGRAVWFAHRGFMRVWKSIEPYLEDIIKDETVSNIIIVGYSHGAAVAVLCHEYVWYHRPDLREKIEGYGFGCPRVFWGIKTKKLAQRWKRFKVIRNLDDIVTHVPPIVFGFSHVGDMITIGEKGKYSMIDAHLSENMIRELDFVSV